MSPGKFECLRKNHFPIEGAWVVGEAYVVHLLHFMLYIARY